MGHGKIIDGMITDGLWDVYNDFHMGNAAELCAKELNISRAFTGDHHFEMTNLGFDIWPKEQ